MKRNAFQIVVWAALLGFMFLSGQAEARMPRSSVELKVAGWVNLNEATVDQLIMLPGIGDAKARAIVNYRSRRKFRSPREVIRVKGIGPKMFRRLEPVLRITGPTTLKPVSKG